MTASQQTAQIIRPSGREIAFTRTIAAPRELVFQAWSEPEHLAHWYGPDGFTLTTHSMDFRAGGYWRYTMHGPDGRDYKNTIRYIEINAPERIQHQHVDEEGTEPVTFSTIVTFEALAEKLTRFTLAMTFDSPADLQYVIQHYHADEGGVQTTNRLAAYIESFKP